MEDITPMEHLMCNKCGDMNVLRLECQSIFCDDGMVDVSEEFYEVEGTRKEPCPECNGKSYILFCATCETSASLRELCSTTRK